MHSRSHSSLLLVYVGVIFTALSVIALGLMMVVKASAGLSQAIPRDKTVVELQIENSREIRKALAVPQTPVQPLPPITARPARDLREIAQARPAHPKLPAEALNAMAMDQTATAAPSRAYYPAADRHATSF